MSQQSRSRDSGGGHGWHPKNRGTWFSDSRDRAPVIGQMASTIACLLLLSPAHCPLGVQQLGRQRLPISEVTGCRDRNPDRTSSISPPQPSRSIVTSDYTDPNDRKPVAADGQGLAAGTRKSDPAHTDVHVEDHGGTLANWTANALIVIAFLVGTVGVVLGNQVVFWVGVALIPIGLIAGKLLSGMGYGKSEES